MRRILLVLAFAAAGGPCLGADASLLSAAFGNTIVSTYPDGRTAQLWLQSDGGYTGEGRAHDRSNGRWWVKDGKLCLKQARPFVFGYVYCTRLAQFATGSSWVGKAVTGEAIRINLVHGRPDPGQG